MSVQDSPNKKNEKDHDDEEDDHLWYLHTPEYLEDPADADFVKEFPARTVLVPALLLCQIVSRCKLLIYKIPGKF